MTPTPTLPPGVPLSTFPFGIEPYNNITPMTNRPGITLLEMYHDLRHWLFKELVPYVDTSISEYVAAFTAAIAQIDTAITDLEAYVTTAKGDIDAKTAAFQVLVNGANTAFNTAVTTALANIQTRVDAAVVAKQAAEAARDLAQTYSDAAGVYNQPALSTVKAFTFVNQDGFTYEYEIVTVKAKGAAINKAFEKTFGDYEKTWVAGSPFSPPQDTPGNFAERGAAYLATNGDAIEGGRMTGMQIKNGVPYADWGSSSGDPIRGVECLAFMKDGSWKTYKQSAGDTQAAIVAAGAHTTFGFGPIVVQAGNIRNIEDGSWGIWGTQTTARTLLGRAANGDIIIALVKGKTADGVGIRGNECGRLMLRHGAFDAIMLDGGGSSQGYSNGRYFHPSSDTAETRPSGNALLVHAPVQSPVRIPREAVVMADGWTSATGGEALTVSKDDGIVRLAGNVYNTATLPNTWYTVGTLPERFRPYAVAFRASVYANGVTSGTDNGDTALVSVIKADGTIQVRFQGKNTVAGVGWAQLDLTFRGAY